MRDRHSTASTDRCYYSFGATESSRIPINPLPLSRDLGSIGEGELLAASLALASIDHVLVLGEDALNDVTMRAGMGWAGGLRTNRGRW